MWALSISALDEKKAAACSILRRISSSSVEVRPDHARKHLTSAWCAYRP